MRSAESTSRPEVGHHDNLAHGFLPLRRRASRGAAAANEAKFPGVTSDTMPGAQSTPALGSIATPATAETPGVGSDPAFYILGGGCRRAHGAADITAQAVFSVTAQKKEQQRNCRLFTADITTLIIGTPLDSRRCADLEQPDPSVPSTTPARLHPPASPSYGRSWATCRRTIPGPSAPRSMRGNGASRHPSRPSRP